VSFAHPMGGARVEVEEDLPEELVAVLTGFRDGFA
jgi:hypothetical protein